MKAVLLVAGKGTRMLPLTKDKPKHFIEINGKPFIHHLLEDLKEAGFKEFGLVVNYRKEFFKEFAKNKDDISIIEQERTLGTGDAVRSVKDFVGGENFVVVMGDNLYDPQDLKRMVKKDGFCYVAGKKAKHPERYGVLVEDQGLLKKIVEKPENFVGDLINVGLYKFTPKVFGALERIKLSPRGEFEVTDAINILAQQGLVKVVKMNGYWVDFGKPEDIKKVEDFIRARK